MSYPFPHIDPIPLPAPVGFFKFFLDLTLTLHFLFVHILVGGLVLAILWNWLGHLKKSPVQVAASGVALSRLPILMTYVINLGVPPLLFTQVLYGRALYTGSLLVGPYWFGIIFALMTGYFLLYHAGKLSTQGKAWWPWGILSLICIMYVGKIYSTVMTLMLTPEVWHGMYDVTARGTNFPPYDPTRTPRFLLMMAASLGFGGLAMALYATKQALKDEVKSYLRQAGGLGGLTGLLLLLAAGVWAFQSQPDFVRAALTGSSLFSTLLATWVVAVLASLIGALTLVKQPQRWTLARGVLTVAPPAVAVAAYVIIRDQVRDVTLGYKGFDVWQSTVNTNWLVVGLFLGSAVVGAAVLLWVLSVVCQARTVEENYE
jgi:hypothetical protein